jgi:DNA-binding CsgD family transcriptional regulator
MLRCKSPIFEVSSTLEFSTGSEFLASAVNAIAQVLDYMTRHPNEAVREPLPSIDWGHGWFRHRFSRTVNPYAARQSQESCMNVNLNGMLMIQRKTRLGSARFKPDLTHEEIVCLKLVANGFRLGEISGELKTEETEVDSILDSAERKLGARNRLHAIGIAVSQGLIGIDGK